MLLEVRFLLCLRPYCIIMAFSIEVHKTNLVVFHNYQKIATIYDLEKSRELLLELWQLCNCHPIKVIINKGVDAEYDSETRVLRLNDHLVFVPMEEDSRKKVIRRLLEQFMIPTPVFEFFVQGESLSDQELLQVLTLLIKARDDKNLKNILLNSFDRTEDDLPWAEE